MDYTEAIKPWEKLSGEVAEGASGTVEAWTGGSKPYQCLEPYREACLAEEPQRTKDHHPRCHAPREDQDYLQVSESFQKTGPNAARSSAGYEVRIAKRCLLEITEGASVTEIPIEIMTDRVIEVATSTLDAAVRAEAQRRVSAALGFLNIPHYFC